MRKASASIYAQDKISLILKLIYSTLFYPITLVGRRGTTDEFAKKMQQQETVFGTISPMLVEVGMAEYEIIFMPCYTKHAYIVFQAINPNSEKQKASLSYHFLHNHTWPYLLPSDLAS